jgi:predicted RNase H-like HicB family nuclease
MPPIIIYPDLEDGGWIAEVPSLPGCITQGETYEEVIANVDDAIETWLEGAKQFGLI